ncbi:MAG: hypothetical protein ACPLZ9_02755 [Candidatus Ratteibacteria bacterium]
MERQQHKSMFLNIREEKENFITLQTRFIEQEKEKIKNEIEKKKRKEAWEEIHSTIKYLQKIDSFPPRNYLEWLFNNTWELARTPKSDREEFLKRIKKDDIHEKYEVLSKINEINENFSLPLKMTVISILDEKLEKIKGKEKFEEKEFRKIGNLNRIWLLLGDLSREELSKIFDEVDNLWKISVSEKEKEFKEKINEAKSKKNDKKYYEILYLAGEINDYNEYIFILRMIGVKYLEKLEISNLLKYNYEKLRNMQKKWDLKFDEH